MIQWKKTIVHLAVLLLVAFASSALTWKVLSRRAPQTAKTDWKTELKLAPDQERKFSALEADFNLALKDIEIHDAQNRIFLCSYLGEELNKPETKAAVQKMVWVYKAKQEKIAATLSAIAAILTPDQRRIFSQTLMHQVCVSCRKSTGSEQCLCGMCQHHA